MLLLIDNYDSFTYNLAQYFGELGCELLIKRNDEIALDEIAELAPDYICISPGPCTPREAGISKEVILRFGPEIPILGVCLGHQCIAEAYGGKVIRASRLMHGKPSMVRHNGSALFSDLPTPPHKPWWAGSPRPRQYARQICPDYGCRGSCHREAAGRARQSVSVRESSLDPTVLQTRPRCR